MRDLICQKCQEIVCDESCENKTTRETIDFRIGDVIEFTDAEYKDKKWKETKSKYVGRIDRIIRNINQPDQDEWELWLEYYSEMCGRMYVIPSGVIRIIERGNVPFKQIEENVLKLGTLVTFTESGKKLLDEICGYEYLFGDGETRWQYVMKHEGYVMGLDEFEVVK